MGADGTYNFVGDLDYPLNQQTTLNTGREVYRLPEAWGDTGWDWDGESVRYPLLLSEYAVQAGHAMAAQQGMHVTEIPAACTHDSGQLFAFGVDTYSRPSLGALLDNTPEKSRVLLLTGGYLPPHLTIIFTANQDGTSSVAIDGGTDSSCYQYTKPFEDALVAVLGDVSLLDVCHVLRQGELAHLERGA